MKMKNKTNTGFIAEHHVLPIYLQIELIEASKIEDDGKRRKKILEIEKAAKKIHTGLFTQD